MQNAETSSMVTSQTPEKAEAERCSATSSSHGLKSSITLMYVIPQLGSSKFT